MQRRIFLGGTMSAGLVRPALAQSDWPSRQVRFLTTPTGTGPNGRVDVVALMQTDVGKALGQRLSEIFGQPFGVPADDPTRGRANILTAPHDGYALFHQPTPAVVQYDPEEFRFFVQPIARISIIHHILVVNRQVPARTVPDFLAQARARPEQLRIAAMPGPALSYLPILFNQLIGTQLSGRLYPSHEAAAAGLLANETQFTFGPLLAVMPLIRSGGVTALATTATRRSRHLPDLPTMQEFLPGFAADWTYSICSRAGVEPAIVRRIEDGTRQAMSSTAVTDTMSRFGFEPAFEAGDSFNQSVDADIRRWNTVLGRERAERRVSPISP